MIDYNPDTGKADSYEQGELIISWNQDDHVYQWPDTIKCRFTLTNTGEIPLTNIRVANKKVGITTTYEELFTVAKLRDQKTIIAGFDIPITEDVSNLTMLYYDIHYKVGDDQTWTRMGSINYQVQPHDYSKDYLTFEALEDGTFTLNIGSSVINDDGPIRSVSYSIDNGKTWNTIDSIPKYVTTSITTPNVKSGDTVLWKGEAGAYANNVTNNAINLASYFSSTGNFNVKGNIMSLLYNDDYIDKTLFPSDGYYGPVFFYLF